MVFIRIERLTSPSALWISIDLLLIVLLMMSLLFSKHWHVDVPLFGLMVNQSFTYSFYTLDLSGRTMMMCGSPHLPLVVINCDWLLTIYLKLERINHVKFFCLGGWDNLHGKSLYVTKVQNIAIPFLMGSEFYILPFCFLCFLLIDWLSDWFML